MNYRFDEQFSSINKLLQFITRIDFKKINTTESHITLQDNSTSEDGFVLKFSPTNNLNCGLSFEVAPIYDSLFIAFDNEKFVELMYAGADLETSIDVIIQILQSPIILTIEINHTGAIVNKAYTILNMKNQVINYNTSKCDCIPGYVMVRNNCFQSCNVNGVTDGNNCQCLPGYKLAGTDFCHNCTGPG